MSSDFLIKSVLSQNILMIKIFKVFIVEFAVNLYFVQRLLFSCWSVIISDIVSCKL